VTARQAFTDRLGGVSAPPFDSFNLATGVGDDPERVAANRALLAAWFPDRRLVWMDQVHGARATVVTAASGAAEPATDALVSADPGVVLAVCVADCVPLLLRDDRAGVVAAVHVGRAGLVAGVVAAALEVMQELAARPDHIRASLGPSIGPCCYEVPETMRAVVAAAVPGTGATTTWGTPSVDLRAGVCAQLAALGIAAAQVHPVCTATSPRHFSYRRDGRTGRFAGVVWV
jgi:YfiH family protein